ncbi:Protein TBATA [Lamellibrachia satsuma]|nr:Protein TBATA [Lamellibrachia satsuma]
MPGSGAARTFQAQARPIPAGQKRRGYHLRPTIERPHLFAESYKSVTNDGVSTSNKLLAMSSSEVFRPSNGPLILPNNLAHGPTGPVTPAPRPAPVTLFKRPQSRPATQGSGRFGQLSYNSFFARHSPHPGRVRHIKGLLDVPICAVNDSGYFANPRYTVNFPPNTYDQHRVKSYSKYFNVPVNAVNVNSQRWPIDTINGLQYFMGKPLNMRIYRENALPQIGIGQAGDAWRDELRALTDAIGIPSSDIIKPMPRREPPTPPPRPRTTEYSTETGRLIPPPSRAMSRHASRQGRREQLFSQWQQVTGQQPEVEDMVMQMLCQILQTDDLSAVQTWLITASDREKNMVLDMIRAALTSREEYYKPQPGQAQMEADQYRHDAINGGGAPSPGDVLPAKTQDVITRIDRLSLDGPSPRPPSQAPVFETYSPPMAGQLQPDNFMTTTQHLDHPNDEKDLFDPNRPANEIMRPASNDSDRRQIVGLKTPPKLLMSKGQPVSDATLMGTWRPGTSVVQG